MIEAQAKVSASVDGASWPGRYHFETVEFPPAISEFIIVADRGCYPDLEAA